VEIVFNWYFFSFQF